jgi:DNA polymerase III gamma/tau subunit
LPSEESEGRSKLIPIAVGAAVLIAIVFVVLRFVHTGNSGPSGQESTLQAEAQQQEKLKDWTGAIATYQSLAQLKGTLAADANSQGERLQQMVDHENDLYGQAQKAAAGGDFASAKNLYQEVADLHGDREAEASDAVKKMSAELTAVNEKPVHTPVNNSAAKPAPAKKPAPPPVEAVKTNPPPAPAVAPAEAAAPAPAKPTANCQLIASDVPRYLNMADTNRGRGKYADAEREYNSVLQCEPDNDRAKSGLARTKQAEAIGPN